MFESFLGQYATPVTVRSPPRSSPTHIGLGESTTITLVGARFQGADNPDFENAVTLFTIDSLPDSKMDTFAVAPVKCRYVRYLYPDIFARGNAGNVAEIAFVGEDGKPLQGKYIGIKEANASNIRTVFDGNTRNYLRKTS